MCSVRMSTEASESPETKARAVMATYMPVSPPTHRLRHMAPIPSCLERTYVRVAMIPGDLTNVTSISSRSHPAYGPFDNGVFALTQGDVRDLMEELTQEDVSYLRRVRARAPARHR
jgi:hypothetical protein